MHPSRVCHHDPHTIRKDTPIHKDKLYPKDKEQTDYPHSRNASDTTTSITKENVEENKDNALEIVMAITRS